jgi:hypothetical protein
MRGSRQPAVRILTNDAQKAFRTLSRHRRTKLAHTAHTTLVKADQWSRGGTTPSELATALEGALKTLQAKGAPKEKKKEKEKGPDKGQEKAKDKPKEQAKAQETA